MRTIMHELAHGLGADHDPAECLNPSATFAMASRAVPTSPNFQRFSMCTMRAIMRSTVLRPDASRCFVRGYGSSSGGGSMGLTSVGGSSGGTPSQPTRQPQPVQPQPQPVQPQPQPVQPRLGKLRNLFVRVVTLPDGRSALRIFIVRERA